MKKVHLLIASLFVMLFFSGCTTGSDGIVVFGFPNDGLAWFATIVFLIIIFAPVLVSLVWKNKSSKDWKDLRVATFWYGGLATLGFMLGLIADYKLAIWAFLTALVAFVSAFYSIAKAREQFAIETACPQCKKLSAMEETERKCIGKTSTTVWEDVETKNKNGDVIGTTRVPIAATRYVYDVYTQCKFCGHKDNYTTSEIR